MPTTSMKGGGPSLAALLVPARRGVLRVRRSAAAASAADASPVPAHANGAGGAGAAPGLAPPAIIINNYPAAGAPGAGGAPLPVALSPAPMAWIPGTVTVQSMLNPPDVYQAVAATGEMKANLPTWKNFLLAVAAGCYTAMFCSLLLTVGPNCTSLLDSNWGLGRWLIGAIGLPFQLLIIKVCGAELFTGSTAQLTTAFYEGRATGGQVARQWASSYVGNAVGCSLGVALLLGSGLVPQMMPGLTATAQAKVGVPLGQLLVRAVLANWFVCLAVWQATAAQSVGSKFIAILGPVSAFIAVGFEHCVANMVFLPLAIFAGVPGITWKAALLGNLLPVTLGNMFAGIVCVATLYSLAFGKLGQRVEAALAPAT